jgi:hypothetical protein
MLAIALFNNCGHVNNLLRGKNRGYRPTIFASSTQSFFNNYLYNPHHPNPIPLRSTLILSASGPQMSNTICLGDFSALVVPLLRHLYSCWFSPLFLLALKSSSDLVVILSIIQDQCSSKSHSIKMSPLIGNTQP